MNIDRSNPRLRLLAEGAVIVGSILLAFGIEAGWEARQERQRANQYLEALRDEVAANLVELGSQVTTTQRSVAAGRSIRRWMSEEWHEAYSDSISDAFLSSTVMTRLSPITSVHDQVVATGDLRLLSTEVRDALGSWQREQHTVTDHQDADALDNRTQSGTPFYLRELGWADIIVRNTSSMLMGLEGEPVRFETDWDRLRADRKLDNLLIHTIMVNTGRLSQYEMLRTALDSLDAALMRDLGLVPGSD